MTRIQSFCFIFPLLAMLALSACQKGEEPTAETGPAKTAPAAAPVEATPLLRERFDAAICEVPIQALPEYRRVPGGTLVLMADDPFLQPVPASLLKEVVSSLREGGEKLQSRLGRVADPLLMPDMSVSAAIDAHLFSRIVWVVPAVDPGEKIDKNKFDKLLSAFGLGDAGRFRQLEDGSLTGHLSGVRFDVVYPAALPGLDGPVALHLDLGYFMDLYRGEIKTPVLPLIGSTLVQLRETDWKVSSVTISLSNHTGRVPLSMRFLGPVLRRLFAEPQLLDQKLPENWERWGKVLYLENFFQNEEIRRLLDLMEETDPQDPAVKYALYHFLYHTGDVDAAKHALEKAVAGDRGYALEYLGLSQVARTRKRPEEALMWLKRLVEAEPDDPLFRLSLVQELVDQKDYEEVRKLLPYLKGLPWSPVYYSDVPPSLVYFQALATGEAGQGRKAVLETAPARKERDI